jgi:hypothetical protein
MAYAMMGGIIAGTVLTLLFLRRCTWPGSALRKRSLRRVTITKIRLSPNCR